MRRLSAISVIAALIVLGCKLTNASASPGTYDADGAPGVHASVDCARGTGYVQIGNQDMSGSAVQVTIDGTPRPDLHVDSTGFLQQWYALAPNLPHRLTIVYDFVPEGTPEEENRAITVSCLDGTPTTTGGTISPEAPVTSTVPAASFRCGSTFTPVSPSRIWDSRVGPAPAGRVGPGEARDVPATGVGSVPSTGVTAVVMNVTAVSPSAATYVTAWPTGEARPLTSNLNVPLGDVRANLVVVKVGVNGHVSFSNDAGTIDLIADVAGYYGEDALCNPG